MDYPESRRLLLKSWLMFILVGILLLGALAIRLYDLTDLPHDFFMVRQYHSLLMARGIYYAHLPEAPQWQREIATAQLHAEGMIEPPIMENLAALIYYVIGEKIWVGHVLASLFWLAGGVAIWLLARELGMGEAGIVALAYFLFLPFGLAASIAFMPDSLMTACIAWSIWSLYRWERYHRWKDAILAGVLTGIAVLVKSVAVFPLLGVVAGLLHSRGTLKKIVADVQMWLVAGLTALPTILFYIYGLVVTKQLGGQFSLRFFPSLLKDPSFYGRWLFTATAVVGFTSLILSLAGILIFNTKLERFMMIGAWIGYILSGFVFPYHFITHEYYHLPLVPIIAIGLIPVADLVVRHLASIKAWFPRLVFAGLLLLGSAMKMWEDRNSLGSSDNRNEIAYYQDLGKIIGQDKKIVQLSGDYGFRLAYWGWVSGDLWMSTADVNLRTMAGQKEADFETRFKEATAGKDLFLITSPDEWENQSDLREYLTDHYPLVQQGEGYWIFNLKP